MSAALDTGVPHAARIYNYLAAQARPSTSWGTSPLWKIVDGPYTLSSFSTVSGAFTMSPNRSYGGPHARTVSRYSGVPFTSDTAEVNAIRSGLAPIRSAAVQNISG